MTRLSRPSYVGWQGNAGISRRALGEGIMAVLVAGSVGRLGAAHAQVHRPVIVFVHGNFENAGFWQDADLALRKQRLSRQLLLQARQRDTLVLRADVEDRQARDRIDRIRL